MTHDLSHKGGLRIVLVCSVVETKSTRGFETLLNKLVHPSCETLCGLDTALCMAEMPASGSYLH